MPRCASLQKKTSCTVPCSFLPVRLRKASVCVTAPGIAVSRTLYYRSRCLYTCSLHVPRSARLHLTSRSCPCYSLPPSNHELISLIVPFRLLLVFGTDQSTYLRSWEGSCKEYLPFKLNLFLVFLLQKLCFETLRCLLRSGFVFFQFAGIKRTKLSMRDAEGDRLIQYKSQI